MKKQLSNKRADDDNPEWSKSDFAKAVPFSGLSEKERETLSSRTRGTQRTAKKIPVSIRLSADVAEGLRATGNGWQTRADEALRMWLAKGKKISSR